MPPPARATTPAETMDQRAVMCHRPDQGQGRLGATERRPTRRRSRLPSGPDVRRLRHEVGKAGPVKPARFTVAAATAHSPTIGSHRRSAEAVAERGGFLTETHAVGDLEHRHELELVVRGELGDLARGDHHVVGAHDRVAALAVGSREELVERELGRRRPLRECRRDMSSPPLRRGRGSLDRRATYIVATTFVAGDSRQPPRPPSALDTASGETIETPIPEWLPARAAAVQWAPRAGVR